MGVPPHPYIPVPPATVAPPLIVRPVVVTMRFTPGRTPREALPIFGEDPPDVVFQTGHRIIGRVPPSVAGRF